MIPPLNAHFSFYDTCIKAVFDLIFLAEMGVLSGRAVLSLQPAPTRQRRLTAWRHSGRGLPWLPVSTLTPADCFRHYPRLRESCLSPLPPQQMAWFLQYWPFMGVFVSF